MPILLENYPDRDPIITDEEAALMEYYLTSQVEIVGGRARQILEKLRRLNKPFLDSLVLHVDTERVIAKARRHLFRFMIQTRRAFWSWSKEIWMEVIVASPGSLQHGDGTRFCMQLLAYLFSDVLYIGPLAPYIQMANVIFGKKRIDEEARRMQAPLIALGYSQSPDEAQRFRRLCALILLVNRSPDVETLSAHTLLTLDEVLTQTPDASRKAGREKRQDLIRLQSALCHLGILDEPVLLGPTRLKPIYPPTLWRTIPPLTPPGETGSVHSTNKPLTQ